VVSKKQPALSNAVILTVAIAVIALTATGFWYYQRVAHAAPAMVVLTPEAKAYVRSLQITDSDMKAHEGFAGVTGVVEITGKIKNAGHRPLEVVEIYCNFYDSYRQLVLRERQPIVSTKMGGLKPGETKSFRLAFDTIPESWNQAMPALVIAQMQFAN
jgi:hypothetical protein